MILASRLIQGKVNILQKGKCLRRNLEYTGDFIPDLLKEGEFDIADKRDNDAMKG
jgi:hypothetical protein